MRVIFSIIGISLLFMVIFPGGMLAEPEDSTEILYIMGTHRHKAVPGVREPCGGCGGAYKYYEGTSDSEIQRLLLKLSLYSVGQESKTLDTLLYYWPDLKVHLDNNPMTLAGLDWTEFLEKEIRHTTARIRMRAVSEDGSCKVLLDAIVTLGEKAHLNAEVAGVQDCKSGLTVTRVGYRSLWSRF